MRRIARDQVRAPLNEAARSVQFKITGWVRPAMRWSALVVVPLLAIPVVASQAATHAAMRGSNLLAVTEKTRAPATGNAKTACLYSVNSVSELERIGAQI